MPLVRGSFNFVSSLVKGYKYTMKSAEKQLTEEDEKDGSQITIEVDTANRTVKANGKTYDLEAEGAVDKGGANG